MNEQAKAIILPRVKRRSPTKVWSRPADGPKERTFHRRLWAVNAWDEIQEALRAEDLSLPTLSKLPSWARPDFANRQEFAFTLAEPEAQMTEEEVSLSRECHRERSYVVVGITRRWSVEFQSPDFPQRSDTKSTASPISQSLAGCSPLVFVLGRFRYALTWDHRPNPDSGQVPSARQRNTWIEVLKCWLSTTNAAREYFRAKYFTCQWRNKEQPRFVALQKKVTRAYHCDKLKHASARNDSNTT